MDKLLKLGRDVALLWKNYGASYLGGIKNTLLLALVQLLRETLGPGADEKLSESEKSALTKDENLL